jgi:hypothetical protein
LPFHGAPKAHPRIDCRKPYLCNLQRLPNSLIIYAVLIKEVAMARKDKYPTSPTKDVHSPERAEQLVQIVNDALNRFSGSADELEKPLA